MVVLKARGYAILLITLSPLVHVRLSLNIKIRHFRKQLYLLAWIMSLPLGLGIIQWQ